MFQFIEQVFFFLLSFFFGPLAGSVVNVWDCGLKSIRLKPHWQQHFGVASFSSVFGTRHDCVLSGVLSLFTKSNGSKIQLVSKDCQIHLWQFFLKLSTMQGYDGLLKKQLSIVVKSDLKFQNSNVNASFKFQFTYYKVYYRNVL